jgi:hypothetical protein
MKRLFCCASALLALAGLSLASPVKNTAHAPSLPAAEASIRTELERHGDRILGKELYHWSTRLEKIEDCRAEFSVRIANHLRQSTVAIQSVNFSLGALDGYGIEMQQNHWLQLPCLHRESCVSSIATCTQTSEEGIITDCSTPSQGRAEAFSLQLDGDPEAAQRLQEALRQVVDACQQPRTVAF